MQLSSRISIVTATALLTALNACTPAGKTPAIPGTTNPAGIAAATKAPVVGYDAASAKAFGNLGEYLGQMNRAVINLENKRPPLMPLKTGVFATKQAATTPADPADETNPPQDVSGDDDFLNSGLQGSGNEAVEKETTAADGSTSGTIDEDGDGTVDETFTETKPVETAKSDGGKTVAMTYAFDRKGDKDVFEVKEDVDANGKVTGGEMDWTDDAMGKQHVTFKGDEITFEPVPGMVFSLKAAGLDAKGHTQMTGNIIFDERFATSQQQPGQGKPLSTQALGNWYYFPGSTAQPVGWGTDGYGWIAAGTWCIDNEVGRDNFGIDAKGGFERIGWEFRRFWCQIKNNDKSWANDWRKARESRLEFRKLAADPALVLKVTATSGNGTLTGSNLIITMPNGAEMRASLPASGEAKMQGVVK